MEFTVEAKTLDLGGTVEVFDLAYRSDPGEFKGSFTLILRDDALEQGKAGCPECGADEYLVPNTELAGAE